MKDFKYSVTLMFTGHPKRIHTLVNTRSSRGQVMQFQERKMLITHEYITLDEKRNGIYLFNKTNSIIKYQTTT